MPLYYTDRLIVSALFSRQPRASADVLARGSRLNEGNIGHSQPDHVYDEFLVGIAKAYKTDQPRLARFQAQIGYSYLKAAAYLGRLRCRSGAGGLRGVCRRRRRAAGHAAVSQVGLLGLHTAGSNLSGDVASLLSAAEILVGRTDRKTTDRTVTGRLGPGRTTRSVATRYGSSDAVGSPPLAGVASRPPAPPRHCGRTPAVAPPLHCQLPTSTSPSPRPAGGSASLPTRRGCCGSVAPAASRRRRTSCPGAAAGMGGTASAAGSDRMCKRPPASMITATAGGDGKLLDPRPRSHGRDGGRWRGRGSGPGSGSRPPGQVRSASGRPRGRSATRPGCWRRPQRRDRRLLASEGAACFAASLAPYRG